MERIGRSMKLLLLAALAASASSAKAQPPEEEPRQRLTVFISDSHWGLGPRDRTEDFLWHKAFRGFLAHVSEKGNDAVDLVILGDFLELWQRPLNLPCVDNADPDLGCTVEEMQALTARVLTAHRYDLESIKRFTRRGSNHVYIVPGNHDAALLAPSVWALVTEALGSSRDSVTFEADGLWTSESGHVVSEHGHQIGRDANRYPQWPDVTVQRGGQVFMIRSWGENFVQALFNAEEREYTIIDNLSPRSAGALYRLGDRGIARSAWDLARFALFNVYETSVTQKMASLGPKGEKDIRIDPEVARRQGHRLIIGALAADDPFRQRLEDDSDSARDARAELDTLVENLEPDELKMLCEKQMDHGNPCGATLGALAEDKLVPRAEVLRSHLEKRLRDNPRMHIFVYGHTHAYEVPWQLELNRGRDEVLVMNTGAFQRLIDKDGYLERVRTMGITPSEGLRRIGLRNLAPCYSAVFVEYLGGRPRPSVHLWRMPESGQGELLAPWSSACR